MLERNLCLSYIDAEGGDLKQPRVKICVRKDKDTVEMGETE